MGTGEPERAKTVDLAKVPGMSLNYYRTEMIAFYMDPWGGYQYSPGISVHVIPKRPTDTGQKVWAKFKNQADHEQFLVGVMAQFMAYEMLAGRNEYGLKESLGIIAGKAHFKAKGIVRDIRKRDQAPWARKIHKEGQAKFILNESGEVMGANIDEQE